MGCDHFSSSRSVNGSVCQDGEEVSQSLSEVGGTKGDSGTESSEERSGMSFIARGAECLIKGYQFVSRYTPAVCKFRPTCSEYTRQAIVKYGFFKGCAMGAWRILRCNPFSRGGHDPVP